MIVWILIDFDMIVDDNNNANDEELRRYTDPMIGTSSVWSHYYNSNFDIIV